MEWRTVDSGYVLIATSDLFLSLALCLVFICFRTNSLCLVEFELNICVWNQIEHAQHLAPGAANRFGKHGIIASVQVNYSSIPSHSYFIFGILCFTNQIVHCNLQLLKYLLYYRQPDHLLDDANSAGNKIGVERAERSSYTFRSLLDGGAQLAFGSDWPVRNSADILVTELCFSVTI